MEDFKTLILRSSRHIGSALSKLNLINEEQLDKAYQLLLESIKREDYHQACLLKYLLFELEALDEKDLIKASNFPLIDLRSFEIADPSLFNINAEACWATWTVVFDQEEDFYYVATAYNLSEPVIQYWQEVLPGKILWHTATLKSVIDALERIPVIKKEEASTPNLG